MSSSADDKPRLFKGRPELFKDELKPRLFESKPKPQLFKSKPARQLFKGRRKS